MAAESLINNENIKLAHILCFVLSECGHNADACMAFTVRILSYDTPATRRQTFRCQSYVRYRDIQPTSRGVLRHRHIG